jgi:hypothetical protein
MELKFALGLLNKKHRLVTMKFNLIAEFIDNGFSNYDESEMDKLSMILSDKEYLSFIKKTNGGSILNNALNFYGILPNVLELEIFYNNYLFGKYYGDMFSDVFVFGEDVFGNQFGFLKNNSIAFLNIETACIDNTFQSFNHFVSELSNAIDYYSGFSVVEKWIAKNGAIKPFQRLSPIKPFVIGGSYDIENFHLLEKESLLDYTSFIAKQIKDLPDGASITLNVK